MKHFEQEFNMYNKFISQSNMTVSSFSHICLHNINRTLADRMHKGKELFAHQHFRR